jgi:hypothetical protein
MGGGGKWGQEVERVSLGGLTSWVQAKASWSTKLQQRAPPPLWDQAYSRLGDELSRGRTWLGLLWDRVL